MSGDGLSFWHVIAQLQDVRTTPLHRGARVAHILRTIAAGRYLHALIPWTASAATPIRLSLAGKTCSLSWLCRSRLNSFGQRQVVSLKRIMQYGTLLDHILRMLQHNLLNLCWKKPTLWNTWYRTSWNSITRQQDVKRHQKGQKAPRQTCKGYKNQLQPVSM